MAEVRTYLELSEADGGSHKFYEALVSGNTLTIRFGRIGDKGQTQVKEFPSHDKALAEASKNGYLYILNRETGQPVHPIKETPVPTETTRPGEQGWFISVS